MFVDASALVAILLGEPEAAALLERVAGGDRCLTSAIAVWEAARAVARAKSELGDIAAQQLVMNLVQRANIRIVTISGREAQLAWEAHARFGKGRHPARLNLGDCFAYACARANGAQLLYKGEDFALTDIETA